MQTQIQRFDSNMKKTLDKVKEDKIPPEAELASGPFDLESEFRRLNTKPLPPISSGIEELDEAFKQAFKKKSNKK